MKRTAITLSLIAGSLSVYSVAIPAAPLAPAPYAGSAAAGKAVYDSKCKVCHGADGNGGAMDKASIAGSTDAVVKTAVHAGKGKMKPIAAVTGDDLDSVALYVASLPKK
jgi:mono/diheme cytochrome c family protein